MSLSHRAGARVVIGVALIPVVVALAVEQPITADVATLAAEALLDAEGGSPAQRRDALRLLDRLGAHPADAADDPRPALRAQARIQPETTRGRLLGPAFRRGEVGGGAVWTIEQTFLAGRPTTVALASRPRQAAVLGIDGPDTAVRCAAAVRCSWVPKFTERYRITVTNAAPAPARFVLVTN